LKEHIDFTFSVVIFFRELDINSPSFSSDSNNLFSKSLFIVSQIFSAGLSSGLYGGKKIRPIFFGIDSDLG
jgi:hypothetical protein